MKSQRFSAALCSFSLLCSALPICTSPVYAADETTSDKLSVSSLVQLTKYLLRKDTLTTEQVAQLDLSADGICNVLDCMLLKRTLLTPEPQSVISVSSVEELFPAIRNAQPGDIIQVAAGTYDYTGYQGAQKIDTNASGTADAPITLTAADPQNPPVFTGSSPENGYVLQITGDYWIVEHICFQNSQKGIVLDNSNYTILRNCEISHTGSEAVALRDGSSYCKVLDCSIHDAGLVTPGYGEGVYIGSSYTVSGFDYKCDYNVVDGCTFKNIAAEHVDVKEYTTGTEIANCTFYGDGMTGENYAGSFLDIAGNDCYVHDNTGYRNGNRNIVAAFELHEQVDGWGYDAVFENNTLYMDQEYGEMDPNRRMYVVDGWFSRFTVKNNQVDYGNGLQDALPEYYNSDFVTFS